MKLSDIRRYNSKPNNHTYLKVNSTKSGEKKAMFPTDEIRYTTAHMKILVISNTVISKNDRSDWQCANISKVWEMDQYDHLYRRISQGRIVLNQYLLIKVY